MDNYIFKMFYPKFSAVTRSPEFGFKSKIISFEKRGAEAFQTVQKNVCKSPALDFEGRRYSRFTLISYIQKCTPAMCIISFPVSWEIVSEP